MAQAVAEFEFKCRRCGEVFTNMDQILTDVHDIAAVRHLRQMISQPGRPGAETALLAIHACKPPEDGKLSVEMGVADLIGYTVRSK